jgi:hypothetical protein
MDKIVPNFNPAKLLHGEQYLKILKPIPTSATVVNSIRLREVLDKGKAASFTTIVETKDKETGELIFENQSTVVLRGSGGFGGKKNGAGESAHSCYTYAKLIFPRPRECHCGQHPSEPKARRGHRREDDTGASRHLPTLGRLQPTSH